MHVQQTKKIVMLTMALLLPSTCVFAQPRPHHESLRYYEPYPRWGMSAHSRHVDVVPVIIRGQRYYYDDGVYYVMDRYGRPVAVDPWPRTVVVAQPEPLTVLAVEQEENKTKLAEGATLGGLVGALLGGIIGHQSDRTAGGAVLGGVSGAVTGGLIGSQIANDRTETIMPASSSNTAMTPAATIAPSSANGAFTVNVPDHKGGYISVLIKRSGNGFTGPQGEYYSEFPTVQQLQAMYVKQ